MLEHLFHNVKRKIALVGCLAGLTLFSGCGSRIVKTISLDEIQQAPQSEAKKEHVEDYSKLDWKEVIKKISTPEEAQYYLNTHFKYENEGRYESFKLNHRDGKGVCFDYALAAAAILRDDGYPSTILELTGDSVDHTIFLYKQGENYHVLGNTPLASGFRDLGVLITILNARQGTNFDSYFIYDMEANHGARWIGGRTFFTKKYLFRDVSKVK